MTAAEAALLGLVQGLTEFLPVSSSGHLALLGHLFGWDPESSLALSVVVHLGTLTAVVVAYRQALLRALLRRRALVPLAVATAPLALAVPLRRWVELAQGELLVVGAGFWVTALLLFLADRRRVAPSAPEGAGEEAPPAPEAALLEELSPRVALRIGLAQLLAVLPGISRSGSTISAGLLQGVPPLLAAEMSFLMAVPAILGATVLEARKIGALASLQPAPLAVGFGVALVSGLLALRLLQWLLRGRRFWVFSPYLALLGALTLWLA